ncbi:MAG: hypothetical protein COU07_03070 [Candidatus Harrisonbacteria bacterium CG10_big_fil_rev_8_21_14_0_10_40_38]|uniref:Polysaccharide biosynthesis protein C-terminal domain-containing protein n=1 Tax=Candidatus Harrisonbacteria bacterium CG10_big_fil_rev_8_21_14_0_10_40_38 TaxID=1974583 RepID=A0A2H0URK8_9BACT|nr:MAG: hypothetical protein COU07_03070 [Candidatus Harrisonbacteria bacterium CG10_big_fil_rev_8_21_14_0_10_40_38]
MSEKLFNSLKKILGFNVEYVFRSGFWLAVDQVISASLSIGLTVAFANLLPQATYGTYRYVLSIFGMLTITTLPNMNIAVSTYVAKGSEGFLFKALKTRVKWGLIGAVSSFVIGFFYYFSGAQELGLAFIMIGVFIPVMDSFNIYEAFLTGKKLFKAQAIRMVSVRIISALSLVVALLLSDNLYVILLAFFLPYCVARPIIFAGTVKKFQPNQEINENVISYGKHLSVIQIMNVVINYLDNVLIFHLLGPISLAVYTIAMAPIKKFQQIFSIIPTLALPKFSTTSIENLKKSLLKKMIRIAFISILGIFIYVIVAPLIFKLALPQYQESIFYSQLLSLVLLTLPFSLIYTVFQSHALKKKLYEYNIAIRIIQITLTVTLIPLFGIIGAVWARIAFQLIAAIVLVILFRKSEKKDI